MKVPFLGIFLSLFSLVMIIFPLFAQPESDACVLETLNGVNLRSGPGTEYEILGSRTEGRSIIPDGQAIGTDGLRWWRTQNAKWVREDLVSEDGNCESLNTVDTTVDLFPELEIITTGNATRIQEIAVLQANEGHSLSISPDSRFAAVSGDNGVQIWDLTTFLRLPLAEEVGGTWFNEVVFSPTTDILAISVDEENRDFIQLLNIETGQILHEIIPELENPFNLDLHTVAIAFSPNGDQLASAHQDLTIRIWNVSTGVQENVIELPGERVPLSIVFHPTLPQLAWATGSYAAIADVQNGEIIQRFRNESSPNQILFSADGLLFAVKNEGEWDIDFWNTETEETTSLLRDYMSQSHGMAFGVDENLFLAAHVWSDMQPAVEIWNLATNEQLAAVEGHTAHIRDVAVAPNGKLLVSSSADSTIRLWGVSSEQEDSE